MTTTGLRPPHDTQDDARLLQHLLTRATVGLPDPSEPTPEVLADAERVLDGRFLLIGEEHAPDPRDRWRINPSADKEWQIAQHKHYFLPALLHLHLATGDKAPLERWQELLTSWLAEMGTGEIAVSDAQVEALRLRSWIDSYLLLRRVEGWHPDGALVRRWVERMGSEAAYVLDHLKPVRNHRTFQLASVFRVGVCLPELAAAPDLVEQARALLTDNLLTDLLPDGVQVEMSTHYHQLVAETAVAFVDLARRNDIALEPALLERVHAALQWSLWLTWPDGRIPCVGDSDDGDHAALLRTGAALFDDPELLWGATRGAQGRPPQERSRHFPASGYVVLRDGWGSDPASYARRTHVLYDAARLGDGAHSHYDLFSFTLHAEGRPAVVDPGRFTYSAAPDSDGTDWRHAFKATTAHNTVTVDGRDQTRYVSRNKHGPDVEVEGKAVLVGERGDWVLASARSAEYEPVHTRLLVFVLRQYVLLVDRVTSPAGQPFRAELALHLPDGCDPALRTGAGEAELTGAPVQVRTWLADGTDARVEQGWVSRTYGTKSPAAVLRITQDATSELVFAVVLGPRTVDDRPLDLQSVTAVAGDAGVPAGFRVAGAVGGRSFCDLVTVPDAGGVPSLDAEGRFVLVRTGPHAAVEWVTGADVTRLALPGVPTPVVPAATLEWSAGR